jgi:SpoVK/Ycf46/Vps4 family AAA+-type ATPase
MIDVLCDEKSWARVRDDTYYFNVYLIERFHNLLSQEVHTLSEMIELVESYHNMNNDISGVILTRHQSCQTCQECGKNMYDSDEEYDDTLLNMACQYYGGVSDEQRKVLSRLKNCTEEMKAIDQMIGMDNIKEEFVRLLKFLATINTEELKQNSFMMHMVIMGPPGHGKTEIAKLLGNAFKKSGLLSENKFITATRADLIGQYCGHTAKETTNMFDKARGGVIFIDEVYALGNPEKRDVFTKECIDTINQLLSERSDTLCIIAGYEHEIKTCFFNYNPGLERRFPWRFKIKPYSDEHLVSIFNKKVADMNRSIEPGALLPSDLEEHRDKFPNAGGDIVNLVTNCLLAYYDNSFLSGSAAGRPMTRADILKGLERYLANRNTDKKNEDPPPFGMYL